MAVTLPDAYYKFDEASGNASDSTVGGNTLTNNGTCLYTSAQLNNGVNFVSATSQYMSHANAAAFQATTSISISGWVKFAVLPGGAQANYVSKAEAASQRSYTIEFGVEPNGMYIFSSKDGTANAGSYDEFDSAASLFAATTWYHVVIIYDVTNGSVQCYVNNVAKAITRRAAQNVSTLFNGTDSFTVGGNTFGRYSDCQIDELGFWKNYKLTSSEVTSLYNSGSPLPYSSFQPLNTNGSFLLNFINV